MHKDTFTFDSFISDNRDFERNFKKSLTENQSTTLQALAGGGKTYFTLKVIIPFLVDRGFRVLFLVPNTVQVSQLKTDNLFVNPDSDLNDTIVVYDSKTKLSKKFDQKTSALICTYDKAPLAFKALYSIENTNEKIFLIVDEFHNLAKSYGYRTHAINQIETIIEANGCKSLFISATPVFSIASKFKSKLFNITKTKYSIHKIDILRVENLSFEENAINQILKNKANGKKSLVFIDNKARAKTIKKTLIAAGFFDDSDIALIQSEQTKEQSKEYAYLAENQCFEDSLQVVLCTQILAQAINIKNTDFNNIYCALSYNDIDSRLFTQFINRFRNLLNDCENINTTILIDSDILDNKKGKKGFKDNINTEKWFASEKYKEAFAQMNTVTPKFSSEKHKSLNVPLPIGQMALSSKYHYLYIKTETEKKKIPSFFHCAFLAENNKIGGQTFENFISEVKAYNPENSIDLKYVSESTESEFFGFLQFAKDEVKEEKDQTIKALYSDIENDLQGVLSFFKTQSRDFNTVSKLDSNETDLKPDGYLNSDKNVYFKKLGEFVSLYNLTSAKIAKHFLYIETLESEAKEDFQVKSLRMAYTCFALAYDSFLLSLNKGENTKKAFELIIEKRPKMRFALNMLHVVIESLNATLKGQKKDGQTEITEKIKALKEKIKTDKSHKSRYLKQIKKLESERNNLQGGIFMEYKEAFEIVKDSFLYEFSSLDTSKFRALVKSCTNITVRTKGFEAKGIIETSFKNLAKTSDLKESDLIKMFSDKLSNTVKKYNNEVYQGLTDEEKQKIAFSEENTELSECLNITESLLSLKNESIELLENTELIEDIDEDFEDCEARKQA